MDTQFLAILVCPLCKGALHYRNVQQELICYTHRLAYPIRDGIPILLDDEARPLDQHETKPKNCT